MSEFKFPTETVDLPSRGLVYPKDHVLRSGKVEIKYMTAKEEDILKGYKLLSLEGVTCEPSSACIIGSLKKLREKNICCIITGNIHKNLKQLQNHLT